MTVTRTSACPRALAAFSPPKPPPTTTTRLASLRFEAWACGAMTSLPRQPLVEEDGAPLPAVAEALLGRVLEQPTHAEDLRLDGDVHDAAAAIVAQRLGPHHTLVADLVGERARRQLPAVLVL